MNDMDEELHVSEDEELSHVGTPKHSGRYPWGSGDNPSQRNKSFIDFADGLKKKGLSTVEIARGCGMTSTEFIRKKSLAKMEIKKEDQTLARILKDKGLSNVAIGVQMNRNESSVRLLLNEDVKERNEKTDIIANMLKDVVGKNNLVDIGVGAERYLDVSRTKLMTSVTKLKDEGYSVDPIYVPQPGMGGNKKTTMLVLNNLKEQFPIENERKTELYRRQAEIKMVTDRHFEDDGKTLFGIEYPASIDSSRIAIKYKEDGGANKDGVIELRRGVDEISLGETRYAQVRIMVDGTHYLKGMAVYSDDLPKGVDIQFNTNKDKSNGKMDVLKKLKTVSKTDNTIDPDNPFGAKIKDFTGQRHYIDAKGKEKLSPINKVNDEGDWQEWSKSLSSQFLAKQPKELAKQQLGLAFDIKKEEFDTIMSLTNPTIKKKLLAEFADGCDSASVHLKAAAMPRQASQVLLPVVSMKDTEIYAPNFRPGESVVLVRYPHGGTFEIPSLIVNNNQREAKKLLGLSKDAVGINPKVAEKLSGADFDGDSVLVIPNPGGKTIMTSASLKGLVDFDPKTLYKAYDGMPKMTPHTKQMEMGKASNLITDMTIAGANDDEICKAVKHSMVVIDAEKHNLNYKQSYVDNGIAALKKRYQNSKGGATTLLSKASSDIRVGVRKEKSVYKIEKNMTPSELETYQKTGKKILNMTPKELADHNEGKKVWEYTGQSYATPIMTKTKIEKAVSDMTPAELVKYNSGKKVYSGTIVTKKEKLVSDMTPEELVKYNAGKKVYEYSALPKPKTVVSTKMAEATDAFDLSSGTIMESIYATHANKLKALANAARKEDLLTPSLVYSQSANKAYKPEVSTLMSKLNIALKNAPLERQATLYANAVINAKKADNPDMEPADLKKIKGQALTTARLRIGAKKEAIDITPREWEAIQAGAISNNTLTQILNNAKPDIVKQLAMPRSNTKSGLTPATEARVISMLEKGNTQRDIADALGISLDSVNALNK